MQDDVWKAPDAAETEAAPAVERGTDGPGDLSDPMAVPNLVFADFKAHLGGYVLSGLGYLAATTVLIGVVLGVLAAAIAPGIVMEDETLGLVGMIFGFAAYTLGIVLFAFVAVPLMNASLLRALDEQRRGGPSIGFTSPFTTLRQDAARVVGFYALTQLLVLVGVLLFYVPGLIAATIGMFALPIVVFERATATEAIRLGWEHLKAHPTWHIPLWLLMFISIVVLELTLVGLIVIYPVMVAFQLYAYRVAYGDVGALGASD